jgi:hypothetical protein
MLTPLTRRTRWLPVSAEHITETMCCVHQCSVHFAGARWNLVHDTVAVTTWPLLQLLTGGIELNTVLVVPQVLGLRPWLAA